MDLGKGFAHHFEILAACNETLRKQVFRVRHEVYCRDLGFEPLRDDELETDAFDEHSVHCLLRSAGDADDLVGCVRLILSNPDRPDTLLPFEQACLQSLDAHRIDSRRLPRHTIAEVSRLAVHKNYRRRRGEQDKPASIEDSDFGTSQSARFPFIPVGLYLGAMAESIRHGLEQVFVLTEPRLASHLARLGFALAEIGPGVEHHGMRVPSVINVKASASGIRPLLRPMWEVVREQIDASYRIHRPTD